MKLNVVLLLAVVNFIHGDECKLLFDLAIVEIGGSLRTIYNHLKGHDQLLQRIPDMQEKLEHLENNLQDMQEKLEHLENNLQGLSRDTAQCLKGEDLENLTNVSAAANQEIKSFHEEMFEVIAWSRKDECLEGGLPCGEIGTCENTLFSFTCSCPSGFTWDGSECKDVDECAEGKDDCVPNATCKNSIGSYSCSCNKPFEGDGRTSCDVDECAEGKDDCVPNAKCKNSIGSYSCSCNKPFEGDGRTSCEYQCRSPARRVPGLGCLKLMKPSSTFHEMKKKCEEEGMRLAQHMSLQQLRDVGRSFGSYSWVGVYDGKWTSDGSLVPEDLWEEGYRSDPSRRCGIIGWVSSSSSYKLYQDNCSYKLYGYCQFPMP
ncbi:uncharacterized protein [Palaemon carinicauda]|uniref:uncharacterized protein isoform X9 n=1 Tax=Palaemon carinicauda TaxID=392227 RepID=UPI0035B5A60A